MEASLDMTIAVDWDVKHHFKQIKKVTGKKGSSKQNCKMHVYVLQYFMLHEIKQG